MSSFHAGASFSASSSLFALESAEIISHHSASVLSVEKPIVVPWKLSRERRICSAALIRSSWRGSLGWRLRIRYQSMTADVGHRLGSIAMLSSHFGLKRLGAARQRLQRRDLADREVGGRQRPSSARRAPRRTRRAPAPSARARARESPSRPPPRSTAGRPSACRRRRASPARTSRGRRGRGGRAASPSAAPQRARSRRPIAIDARCSKQVNG